MVLRNRGSGNVGSAKVRFGTSLVARPLRLDLS